MGQYIDLTGIKFARLAVIERDMSYPPATGGKSVFWRCFCDCMRTVSVRGAKLKNGETTSCGCARNDAIRRTATTHKMTGTKIYRIWKGMISRCTYPSSTSYPWYGARGITVCSKWRSFENFYADVGDPPPGKSLDRRDNNGNYEPGNCRWATKEEQTTNRRKRVSVSH